MILVSLQSITIHDNEVGSGCGASNTSLYAQSLAMVFLRPCALPNASCCSDDEQASLLPFFIFFEKRNDVHFFLSINFK